MPTKKLICRDHPGGKFTPPARRGRPPVRCTDEFPCTAKETAITPQRGKAKSAHGRDLQAAATPPVKATPVARGRKAKEDPNPPIDQAQKVSITYAMKAKRELQGKGWQVEGKASGAKAEITAVRDDEMLIMIWDKGVLTTSQYGLWSMERPSDNGMPKSELPSDLNLDEMTDREIVMLLSGQEVAWWNRLGSKRETAVISPDKVSIEHMYDGQGNETPADRIVKFHDFGGTGFRAFRLGQLIRIGH